MNERIKELATEVGISVEYLTNTKQWTLIEALAELIVRECLLSLEPDLYSEEIDYEFEQRFYKRCRAKIVKHFGIKE